MKKIIFTSLEEFYDFKERFKKAIVYAGNEVGEMYVIVKNYIISQLIENEGFDEKDFLPIFVKSINTVEEIKKLMGEPKNFYYRYFQMKKQYLVSC